MNHGLAANINARVGPDDTLWCLGDWVFGRGSDYLRNARWFRDQIRCRTIFFVWGNHDDRRIRDLFTATYDQVEIREGPVRLTLNHYPMLTWNGQHHASVAEPNIHLYGHVHAVYQKDPETSPLKDPDAWPALDVGFDGHDYQVWSLEEILDRAPAPARGVRGAEDPEAAVRPVPGPGEPWGGPGIDPLRRDARLGSARPRSQHDVSRFPRLPGERRRAGHARGQPRGEPEPADAPRRSVPGSTASTRCWPGPTMGRMGRSPRSAPGSG